MNELTESLSLIFARKDSRRMIILSTLFFFLMLLAAQNGKSAGQLLTFTALSFPERCTLFLKTFFDIQDTFTASTLILAILGSFFGGINLSMAYTYMRMRGEIILKSGLYSGLGMLIAFLGIGCAACGTALLSVLLGFFGFSTMLNVLPYKGEEIGYIGLLILFIATYALSKKVAAPGTC